MEIITWLGSNWADLGQGLLMVVGGASVIVKLTPTPKDDAVVAWLYKIFNFVALNKK